MGRISIGVAINQVLPALNSRYALQAAFYRKQDDISQSDQQAKQQQAVPIYMENVLPIEQGYRSIRYTNVELLQQRTHFIDQTVFPVSKDIKYIFCRDSIDNVTQLWIDKNKAAFYNSSIAGIEVIDSPGQPSKGEEITWAYLKDATYIFIPGQGLFNFDIGTNSFLSRPMSGLDFDAIKGIVAAGGYLVAYDGDTIYWSSVITPTDFVPSTQTGAGSTKILGLAGGIVGALPLDNGFIIYTSGNAVAAFATGNALQPFGFRELAGSAGIKSLKQVAWNPAVPDHVAYTSIGLMALDKNQARLIFPEISDFISADILESVTVVEDPESWGSFFEIQKTPGDVALHYLLNRYLVISYGDSVSDYYQYMLVFDKAIGRWGKLHRNHVSVYPYATLGEFKVLTYLSLQAQNKTWLDIQADGTVFLDWFEPSTINHSPELLIGMLALGDPYHKWDVVDAAMPTKTFLDAEGHFGAIIFGYHCVRRHSTSILHEVYVDSIIPLHPEIPVTNWVWVKAERSGFTEKRGIPPEGMRGSTDIHYPRMTGERFQIMVRQPISFDLHNMELVFGTSKGRR